MWWRGSKVVAIEAKPGREFRREYRKGLEVLLSSMRAESYVVYLGDRELEVDGTRVLPLESFLRRLHRGEVLG